jgi:uncharacterized protein (TIGR03435 family)
MKRDERNIEEVLESSLPSASTERMEPARERILNYVQSEDTVDRNAGDDADFNAVRGIGWLRLAGIAAVAAVMIAAVWIGLGWQARGVYARLEAADGSLSRIAGGKTIPILPGKRIEAQEIVRAGSEGSTLVLADGSRVEMRAQSELSLERADDGVRIRLNSGDVIVNAAKQHGHLYVQTRDLKVSVVGTVFLVNADDNGSRVAVLEGEVRVQQGTVEKSLRPGEQFPFNPNSEDLQFFRETGWSREAYAYLSKLHRSMAQSLAARQSAGRTPTVSDKAKFEEASIRLCEKDIQAPAGARGGGSDSIRISPGRVDAVCMTLPTLIRTAYRSLNNNPVLGEKSLHMNQTYGLGKEDGTRVRGGADWVRSEKYTIAAIGDSTDAATLEGPMLLELLERRFKLKSRVETEETSVYALTIANGGLKIKPLEPERYEDARKLFAAQVRDIDPRDLNALVKLSGSLGCSLRPRNDSAELNRWREAVRRGAQPPPCVVGDISWSGPNDVVAVGAMPLGVFINMLREHAQSSLYDTLNGLFVIDRTGLPDTNCLTAIPPAGTLCAPLFSFVMEYARDESFFTRTGLTPADLGVDLSLPKAPSVFAAVEKLGLHLEKIKASREFIVIEHIERPSPN